MQSPADLVDTFRTGGLKVTPQRQLLFRLLHDNDGHPTAEALYERASDEMPGISLRTVYQTLTDLTAMGELRQFTFDAGPGHFDPNTSDHHHAVCDRCGFITDVYIDGAEQLDGDGLDGFTVDSASIVFRGLCSTCATDRSPSETSESSNKEGTARPHDR